VIAWVAGVAPVALALLTLAVPFGSPRWVATARAAAFGAALAVVLGLLLPDAAARLGVLAWVLGGAGLLAPWLIEWTTRRHGEQLAFAGLLVHQVVDGVQIGLIGNLGPAVTLAIGAHGAPLVAAAVLATAARDGVRPATREGIAFLVATCAGVAIGVLVPGAVVDPIAPYVQAVIGGLLLHVVWHGVDAERPRSVAAWGFELACAVGAAALVLLLVDSGH
jgi:hypothetical protein